MHSLSPLQVWKNICIFQVYYILKDGIIVMVFWIYGNKRYYELCNNEMNEFEWGFGLQWT